MRLLHAGDLSAAIDIPAVGMSCLLGALIAFLAGLLALR